MPARAAPFIEPTKVVVGKLSPESTPVQRLSGVGIIGAGFLQRSKDASKIILRVTLVQRLSCVGIVGARLLP
jgi:hypothetical protein